MAESPSPIASSIVQAPVKAGEVSGERGVRRADQVHAATRQTQAVDEAGNTVDTTDADARVFADAEGGGSQGRPFEEARHEQPSADAGGPFSGITEDPDGQLHIDLQA